MVNSDYHLMVTILIAAIIISILFHIFTYTTEASFSEIYFEDELPNRVNLNQTYNFSFSITNHEDKPKTYTYLSKLELFNLHDVTEGIYRCAARNRKKVVMEWLEDNTSLYTESDDYGIIEWPYYSLQYGYTNLMDGGTFTTIFHNEDEIYSFIIYEDSSEIEFKTNKSIRKKVELKPDNEILINATDRIRYYLNNEEIFNEKIELPKKGKFDFKATTLPSISNLVLYKDSPIEVRQSKNIREFDIGSSVLVKRFEGLRQNIDLARKEIDISTSNTSSFFNNPGDIFTKENTYSDALSILSDTITARAYQSYSYTQNSTLEGIPWKNYTFMMDFQPFLTRSTLLLNIDNQLIILFHNSDVFLISDKTIERRRSPVEVGANRLVFDAKENFIVISINDLPLFSIEKSLSFKNISLYTKNTVMGFGSVILVKKTCYKPTCRIIYNVESERQFSRRDDEKIVSEPVELNSELSLVPLLDIASIFKEYSNVNDTSLFLDYDIEIDPSLINEGISSEEYAFDGENAIVQNKGNYSFSYSFNILEGIGLLETSFHKNDGEKILTVLVNQPESKTYLFTNIGTISKKTADTSIDPQDRHRLDILHEAGKVGIYLDGKKLFGTTTLDMSNGFFSISTLNTHFNIMDITLFDRETRQRMPYYIDADPCRLRKITEIMLDKNYLYLDVDEKSTIERNFTVDTDFDYGLVSVTLEDKEIHFWVVNDD